MRRHNPLDNGAAVHPTRIIMPLGNHNSCDDEVADGQTKRSANHDVTQPPAVHEEDRNKAYHGEHHVLDGRRDKLDVSTEAGHLHDVDYVIHDGIPASELTPDVGEDGYMDAMDVAWLDQVEPGAGAGGSLEAKRSAMANT